MPKAHRPGRGPSVAPPGTLAGRRARQDSLSYHDIPEDVPAEDTPDVPDADANIPPGGQGDGTSGATTPEAGPPKTPEAPPATPVAPDAVAPKPASTSTRARAGVAQGAGKSRA